MKTFYQSFRFAGRIIACCLILSFSLQMTAQTGQYDLRFNLNDCDEDRIYVDIEVKSSTDETNFDLADQNYRFSFTRDAVANPFIAEELEVSGGVSVGNDLVFYSPHDLNGSGDTIVSYNLELLSTIGFPLSNEWVSIGRVGFDIVDPTACLELTWHTENIFPSVFISEVITDVEREVATAGTLENFNICLSECGTPLPPVANDDNVTVSAGDDGVFNILTNDAASAGSVLETVTLLNEPPASQGMISANNFGLVIFTPATGFVGTVAPVTYEVCADNGLCDQAVINITVDGEAPTANDDNITIDAGDESVFNMLSNDIIPDGTSTETVTLLNTPPASEGVLTTNNFGLTTFTPALGFIGNVTPITYEVCTDNGLCDQAVIYITVEGEAPTANDDNVVVNAGIEGVFNVLSNDMAPAGAMFETVVLLNSIPPSQGIITINDNGLTTFAPALGFTGSVTPLTYEVCANNGLCDQAMIFITVEGETPTANDDNVVVLSSGGAFNILTNDVIPTGQIAESVTILTNLPTSQGTITVNNGGLTNFTPANGFFGNVSPITYELCADNGLCDQAIINITVQTAPPTVNDDNISINAGSNGTFNILTNDNAAPGTDFSTITLLNNVPSSQGIITTNDNGLTTFTPTVGFVGSVTPVDYEVCADNGLCDQATIFITVVGEAPVANDDNVLVLNSGGAFNILTNDVIPAGQIAESVTILTNLPASQGTITANNSGLTNFTPANGFFGNVSPITYELCADNGLCDQAIINITVQTAPPTANDDNVSINAGSGGTFNILTNDNAAPGTDFSTITLLNNVPSSQGIITTNDNGLTTFTPTVGFVGSVTPVDYEVCADNGLCDEATIFITVVGEAPVANDDNVVVLNSGGAFNILVNDVIPAGQNVETVTILTNLPASQGTITANNNGLTNFTPANGFFGNVSPITYELCADNGLCDQAIINITVQTAPPTANDDNISINAGSNGTFNILTNDNAAPGTDFATITLLNNVPSSQGIITTNDNGLTTFTPTVSFVGSVTPVDYEVCADNGLCDEATIFITVVGEAPVANDDNVVVLNSGGAFNILMNDVIPAGQNVETVTILTNLPASQGTITANNSGLTNFTPAVGFSGDVTPIDYQLCLTNSLCDEATIFINVSAPAMVDIVGAIYGKDGTTPLTKVDIALSGDEIDDLTTITGSYSFDVTSGGNYTITPTKTGSMTNGVTSIDLAISQGHILGLFDLGTVYDVIAMDVNQSCTLSSVDLAITQAVILGILDEFPEGKSWKFIPANIEFPNIDTPCDYEQFLSYENLDVDVTEQNFIGVKIGDVNNSYDPTGGFTSNAPMRFSIADAVATPNEIIQIPVSVSEAIDIATWQLTHTWDANVLEFQGIEMINEILADGLAFGEQAIEEGQLTSLWLHPENLSVIFNEEIPAYYLTFRVVGEIGTSTQISTNSAITPAIAYNNDFEEISIISTDGLLEIQAVTNVTDISSENNVLLFSNMPNPFHDNTVIQFELPHAGEVNILIYNILGKEIKRFDGYYNAGMNTILWDDAAQFPAGVYTCELQFEQHQQTIKLLRTY